MKFGIVGNISKPKIRQIIPEFACYLDSLQVEYLFDRNLQDFLAISDASKIAPLEDLGQQCDVVITFGGDGTLLHTASKVGKSGVPLLGVNIGALGFLTEILVKELQETVQHLLQGHFQIIERMVLETRVEKQGQTSRYYALNDIVVDKGKSGRLITIDITVDDMFLNRMRSDGVIVSTPTGSTAYSLSAGGPLMQPAMKAVIITPICPHSLAVRPIVLSDESVVRICLQQVEMNAQINIDGQYRINISAQDVIIIKKADYAVKWISTGKRCFFEILRTKLNWGADLTALNIDY
jgi:NAD+ kinase